VRVRLAEGVEAVADAVISPIEVEVLISDKLADELMIAIERDPARACGGWGGEHREAKRETRDLALA
jgi:hypothetical protein